MPNGQKGARKPCPLDITCQAFPGLNWAFARGYTAKVGYTDI